MISIIVAMDRQGGIGYQNVMPWSIPGELKQFKALTLHHSVVMGRKTFESIGHPLVHRTNYVVTTNPAWNAEGVLVIRDFQAFLREHAASSQNIFVIGGAQIYAYALPYVSTMIISLVDGEHVCDTFFPEVDWTCFKAIDVKAFEGFTQTTYERICA